MPQIDDLKQLSRHVQQISSAIDYSIQMKTIESDLPERELCENESIENLKKQIFELFRFLGINYQSNEKEKNFFQ